MQITPNLKSEFNNITPLYLAPKEQNDYFARSQAELNDDVGNFSIMPKQLSRRNSLNSLHTDVALLKSNFYRKNTQPSSKALMIARLNKSKNSLTIKNNKNSVSSNSNQSNLFEIQEHLDKIKIPLKKSKSSISFKKTRQIKRSKNNFYFIIGYNL